MKETIATILYNIGFKFTWVVRNAKLFYQKGKKVSWEQLENKEKDFSYHFINGRDVYPKTYYNYGNTQTKSKRNYRR